MDLSPFDVCRPRARVVASALTQFVDRTAEGKVVDFSRFL